MEILQQYNNKLEHYRHLFSELEIIKARMKDADEDRKKFIYDWVSKKHPSWLKDSVIKENLKNDDDPNYYENIDGHINQEKSQISISILIHDKKATRLANKGFEIEDLVWETHIVKLEDFK